MAELQISAVYGCESPFAALGVGPRIPLRTLDDTCFRQITEWVDHCADHHGRCEASARVPLPTRLLDIAADSPRLVETTGMNGSYAALSHCWVSIESCSSPKSTNRALKSLADIALHSDHEFGAMVLTVTTVSLP
jgi:hypothetical protein